MSKMIVNIKDRLSIPPKPIKTPIAMTNHIEAKINPVAIEKIFFF